jgi:hypothetical protein
MKQSLLCLCLLVLLGGTTAQAATLGYVPMDDRPVNLEYVQTTVQAAGEQMVTPPTAIIAGREHAGSPDQLWNWVFEHASTCDAMALSTDSLIYGGLVPSRTHFLTETELKARVEKFKTLKQQYPGLRLYLFGTIMRTPHMSAGGTEPPYYEKVGPQIFQITALEDKREIGGLTTAETAELARLLTVVPTADLADWRARRAKNYQAYEWLRQMAREGIFQYFLLGRDDSSPLSASHQESRHLEQSGAAIDSSRYLSIPGADNLGMSMVVHAINDSEFRLPFVKVFYAPGVGSATVASYEDHPLAASVPQHIIVSGGVQLDFTDKPDLVLAVNSPANGITLEAGQPENVTRAGVTVREFVRRVGEEVADGHWVAVGDVAFGNGADNSLMTELQGQELLPRLAAYSGWNTAGNTLGYTVGQGMLAPYTSEAKRRNLLATRYLDDWAYQANIRGQLYQEIVYPSDNNGQYLNALRPRLTRALADKIREFAAGHLWPISPDDIQVSFPWNRMFEVSVTVH